MCLPAGAQHAVCDRERCAPRTVGTKTKGPHPFLHHHVRLNGMRTSVVHTPCYRVLCVYSGSVDNTPKVPKSRMRVGRLVSHTLLRRTQEFYRKKDGSIHTIASNMFSIWWLPIKTRYDSLWHFRVGEIVCLGWVGF